MLERAPSRLPAHLSTEAFTMRSFTPPAGTRFYAGVDLHARALFVVILDHDGQIRFAKNLPANPDAFLRAVAPFRDGLLVACECMHCCWATLARRHLPRREDPLRPRPRLGHESRPRPEDQVRQNGCRGHRPTPQGRQPPARLRLSQGRPRPARPLTRPPPPRPPARPSL